VLGERGLPTGRSAGTRAASGRGIDEDTLKQVADATGGTYYPAENADQLKPVFAQLPTNLIAKHEVVDVSVGFVGLGVVLAGLAVLLGRAWRPLP
jgi:Ca-activated chloride channel homolog